MAPGANPNFWSRSLIDVAAKSAAAVETTPAAAGKTAAQAAIDAGASSEHVAETAGQAAARNAMLAGQDVRDVVKHAAKAAMRAFLRAETSAAVDDDEDTQAEEANAAIKAAMHAFPSTDPVASVQSEVEDTKADDAKTGDAPAEDEQTDIALVVNAKYDSMSQKMFKRATDLASQAAAEAAFLVTAERICTPEDAGEFAARVAKAAGAFEDHAARAAGKSAAYRARAEGKSVYDVCKHAAQAAKSVASSVKGASKAAADAAAQATPVVSQSLFVFSSGGGTSIRESFCNPVPTRTSGLAQGVYKSANG
eukprot:TRINITY_DN7101_c0_g1_i2.p1 TRINITY_DN7101_c0_g1~~TRINITY_DN7101_c0_g1_i2.p1  ORF type:complete len:309 (+),score=77.54 TRINITY_DN7101_c0_g1_i2:131-1057(+)